MPEGGERREGYIERTWREVEGGGDSAGGDSFSVAPEQVTLSQEEGSYARKRFGPGFGLGRALDSSVFLESRRGHCCCLLTGRLPPLPPLYKSPKVPPAVGQPPMHTLT